MSGREAEVTVRVGDEVRVVSVPAWLYLWPRMARPAFWYAAAAVWLLGAVVWPPSRVVYVVGCLALAREALRTALRRDDDGV